MVLISIESRVVTFEPLILYINSKFNFYMSYLIYSKNYLPREIFPTVELMVRLTVVVESVVESAVVESAVEESAVVESAVVQSAVVQSAVVESAVVESAVVQSALVESAVVDISAVVKSLAVSGSAVVKLVTGLTVEVKLETVGVTATLNIFGNNQKIKKNS